MNRARAIPYVAYIVDDAGSCRKPQDTQFPVREAGGEYRYASVLVGWQCGFEPLFVAVHSYLDVAIDDSDAEDMASEYLAEIGWFAGEPTDADYIIR